MRYPEIAKQVKKARLARGWSQERAASEVGTSRIHWIRWEQGLHKPTGHLAARLTEVLGLPEELLADDDSEAGALELARSIQGLVRREVERNGA